MLAVTTLPETCTVSGTVTPTGTVLELYYEGNLINTTTADDGSYTFSGLAQGKPYQIRAYCFINTFQGYYPQTKTVTPTGDTETMDFSLETTPLAIVTDSSTGVWGTAIKDGDDVIIGDVVSVEDMDSTICGIYFVQYNGEYGIMTVYGDETGTPGDEGMSEGERMVFRINGKLAQVLGPDTPDWSDAASLNVNLSSQGETCALIDVHQGWNCITVRVLPTVKDLREVFSGLVASTIIMRQYNANGVGVYDPTVAFRFCSFTEVAENYGIQMKLTQGNTFMIIGQEIPSDTVLTLHKGWNIVPYYGAGAVDVETYFEAVINDIIIIRCYQPDGTQVWDPSIPSRFNTLTTIEAPYAYQVKMKSTSDTYVLRP